MKRNKAVRRGVSYQKRVEEVNRIYDRESRRGLPNREIWRRHVYPVYGISERTFYNLLNAIADERNRIADDDGARQLLLWRDEELPKREDFGRLAE